MRAKIYKPSPVFLPRQLLENNRAIAELLLSYTASYCYGANAKVLLPFGLDEILAAKGYICFFFNSKNQAIAKILP